MLYDKRWEQPAETKRKTWRDILLRAADIIEQGGWCQQEYYTNKGSHCAIGALSKANGYRYTVAYGIAVGKLEREIHDNGYFVDVTIWNDLLPWDTGAQTVIETMRKVAAQK